MKNIRTSNEIVTALFPPPIEETDPRSDLEAFLETKSNSIMQYSRKPDRKDSALQRMIEDHERLQGIYEKLNSLVLFPLWFHVEQVCRAQQDRDHDSIMLIIPLVNGSKGYRHIYFNFCDK